MLSRLAAALSWQKKIEPVRDFTWDEIEELRYPCRLKRDHFKCKSDLEGHFEFEPGVGTNLPVGKHTLIVTFMPENEEIESQVIRREVEVLKAIPEVTWKPPHYINEGTPLGRKQLSAACINLPGGEYNYTPDIRHKYEVGEYTLRVEYEPEPEYRKNYGTCVLEVPLSVVPMITPVIEWPPLSPISYEDVVSKENIMTATAPGFDGKITYDPPEGTLLQAGADQLVKAMFTPYNRNEYRLASKEQLLTVKKAIPRMIWPVPSDVYTGTLLTDAQLNAKNDLTPCETALYQYDPPLGSDLQPGKVNLSLTFTPDERLLNNYEVGSYIVPLTVLEKKVPIINWADGADILSIYYGQDLGRKSVYTASCKSFLEFGKECTDPEFGGTITYSPKIGTILESSFVNARNKKREAALVALCGGIGIESDDEETKQERTYDIEDLTAEVVPEINDGDVDENDGLYEISMTFTPHNKVEFATVTVTKRLLVKKGEMAIDWDGLKDLMKNKGLHEEQMCAAFSYHPRTCTRVRTERRCETIGQLGYSLEEGTIFRAGSYPIVAVFTPFPEFACNYAIVTREETMHVVKPAPELVWPDPPFMYKGYVLSQKQQNCSCPELAGGVFTYDPAPGTELTLGTHTLHVRYTVATEFESDYMDAEASQVVHVKEAQMPVLTWNQPAALPYNHPLTQFQLNATTDVEGFFYYDPPRGTVLEAGETHTLRVIFTPDDHLHWLTTTAEVTIEVFKADPELQWEITETFYSGMHLQMPRHLRCCTKDLHLADGDMHYTPGVGAVLGVGSHTLTVNYNPPKHWKKRYNAVSKSINLVVHAKLYPPIVWETYDRAALDWDAIVYGTKLAKKHLNAYLRDDLKGAITYDPPMGTILDANTTPEGQLLSMTFEPEDTEKYLTVTIKRSLRVEKATPHLEWTPKPLPFMYVGKELTEKTCNAITTSKHPITQEELTGRFVYCPQVGEVLPLGKHTMTVIFQPHERFEHNYTFASKFIMFPVIEVGSLFRLPKRYTDPEPRPVYQDDREYLGNGPMYGPVMHGGRFYYSEIDTVMPSDHDRKIMEKKDAEKQRSAESERERMATR
jgi:hypothetical protein